MKGNGLLLGYDIGSSSIKATLIEAASGAVVAAAGSPDTEMEISAPHKGWAEQHPDLWWGHLVDATAKLQQAVGNRFQEIKAIGISYQMHGLVVVDDKFRVLRPAIIWCDSRAVEIGERAFRMLGEENFLKHFLNSPGNFTASKLKWVMDNESDIYGKIRKAMLPGDYIAARLTGKIRTTASGISEAILWNFTKGSRDQALLDYYGIDPELFPESVDTFGYQGEVTLEAAAELGLPGGTQVSYRAGDQPNNAFSLKVLDPGEVAATAGTSGVIYGVVDQANYDPRSRVNTFVHVNHHSKQARYGILLCVNGSGVLNRWIKQNLFTGRDSIDYNRMNELAAQVPVGSDGLVILPFGNGAERTLGNRDLGASIHGLRFNRHDRRHLLRAGQEGIVFALAYGLEIMKKLGLKIHTIRAGQANMFLSPLFSTAFATITGARLELFSTDGSQGAARAAGVGAGIYSSLSEAFTGLSTIQIIEPDESAAAQYRAAYRRWVEILEGVLAG